MTSACCRWTYIESADPISPEAKSFVRRLGSAGMLARSHPEPVRARRTEPAGAARAIRPRGMQQQLGGLLKHYYRNAA